MSTSVPSENEEVAAIIEALEKHGYLGDIIESVLDTALASLPKPDEGYTSSMSEKTLETLMETPLAASSDHVARAIMKSLKLENEEFLKQFEQTSLESTDNDFDASSHYSMMD